MQLEELRMNQKMGEADPALVKDLETHRAQFEKKYEELAEELKSHWNQWDQAIDGPSDEERRRALGPHGRSAEPPQLHQEPGSGRE